MALGFCPALLHHINDIAGNNAPSRKLNVAGFLAMLFCCANSSVSPLNDAFDNGHTRGMTVKYRLRPTLASVQTDDDCDINAQPGYLEWTVAALSHVQYSFHIADNLVAQYCEDASRMRSTGAPPTNVMQEVYELIVEGANVVLSKINQMLVTSMATEFGINTENGSANGKFININRDSSQMILNDGIIEMLQDFRENEICGEPCIVGGGLFSAYQIALQAACCNQAGQDARSLGVPRFFFDKQTTPIWGLNSIGVFAPGSVKFLSRNKFVGSFAGQKGTSFFATLPLPVNEFGCPQDCLSDLVFDIQLKYYDCPTTTTVNGVNTTVQRGWQVIIGKDFALWVQPDSGYAAGDPLFGTNGTLKYFFSNTSYAGGSYAGSYV